MQETRARLVVGTSSDVTAPSPFTAGGLGAEAALLVFRPLFRPGESGRLVPDLVESFRWSSDGRTVELLLRDGQHFSDGSPITAEDVVDTYRRVKEIGGWSSIELQAISSLGPRTVVVQPSRPFLMPGIVIIGVARRGSAPPRGGGPYSIVAQGDHHLELGVNPAFDGPVPSIGAIEFRHFDKASEEWSSLLARRVDLITMVPWNKFDQLSVVPTVRTVSGPSNGLVEIQFRQPPAPFDAAVARRALSIAIDRRELVHKALHGQAIEASGIVWPKSEAFDSQMQPTPYAPEEARRLLVSAGCVARPDGTISFEGAPLHLEVEYLPGLPGFEAIALLIQRQLADVGVAVSFRALGMREMRSKLLGSDPIVLLRPRHAAADILFDDEVKALPPAGAAFDLSSAETVAAAIRTAQRRLRDEGFAIHLLWVNRLDVIDRRFCGLPSLPEGPVDVLDRVHLCAPGEDR